MIVGIDEVGRGCLAGPVVAGAVILKRPIEGLRDSKLLSRQQREALVPAIEGQAVAIGLGWVQPAVIDEVGLTEAVRRAMLLALSKIKVKYEQIIIDGKYNFMQDNQNAKAIIMADNSVPAVSAASILAKVARDRYMAKLTETYPEYGFEQHVGYGTALHLERLHMYGLTDQHRRSFGPVKALL